jgi:asparagine synthase (glutamine-hydrolysing)
MFCYIESSDKTQINDLFRLKLIGLRKSILNHQNDEKSMGLLITSEKNDITILDHTEIIYWYNSSNLPSQLSNQIINNVKTINKLREILKINRGWDFLIFYSRILKGLFIVQNHIAYPDVFYLNNKNYFIVTDTIELIYKLGLTTKFTINTKALQQYLYNYFISKTQCIFDEIEKIQPGQIIKYTENRLDKYFYWAPNFDKIKIDHSNAVNRWDDLISNSIKSRINVSDDINLFLSGGIDSGLLTYYCKKYGENRNINCYTTKIYNNPYDESELAKVTAKYLGANQFYGNIKRSIIENLPEIVWYCQEPYADRSMLGMYQIGQQYGHQINNIISGDAEGHGRQFAYKYWLSKRYRRTIPSIIRYIIPKITDILKAINDNKYTRELKTLSRFGHPDPLNIFKDGGTFNLFEIEEITGIVPNVFEVTSINYLLNNFRYNLLSNIDKLTIVGLYLYCYSDYPKRLEIFQKRFGCIVDLPFLDKDILEFILKVPENIKYMKRDRKPLTRGVARRYLPLEIITAKKSGWYNPAVDWLFDHYESLIRKFLVKDLGNRGILERIPLQNIVDGFFTKRTDGYKVWMLLVLEVWFKMFVDRSISKNDLLSDI